MSEQQRPAPGMLCAALQQLVTQWYGDRFPHEDQKLTPKSRVPRNAVMRLAEASTIPYNKISEVLLPTRALSSMNTEKARNGWATVTELVEFCIPDHERADWYARLAGLWMSPEQGVGHRPPDYVDAVRLPDGRLLPALTDAGQAEGRLDLQVGLLHRQVAVQQGFLTRVHERYRRLRAREHQWRHLYHGQANVLQPQLQQLADELDRARHQLAITERGAADLQRLLAAREQQLAEQAQEHEAAQQENARVQLRLQREQVHLLQYLLAQHALQNQRMEQLAADLAAAHHDAVQREQQHAAERDAAQQREQQLIKERDHARWERDSQLAAAGAHIDQLTAELAERTATIAELTGAPTARDTTPVSLLAESRPPVRRTAQTSATSEAPTASTGSDASGIPSWQVPVADDDLPPLVTTSSSGNENKPPRGKKTLIKVGSTLGGLLAVVGLAWATWLTPGLTDALDYVSGDRPTILSQPAPGGTGCQEFCPPKGTNTLTWKVTPARAVTTVLTAEGPQWGWTALGGPLTLVKPCPDTTVVWTLKVNQAPVLQGDLTPTSQKLDLTYSTADRVKEVTVSLAVLHGTCDATVEWVTGHR